MKKYRSVEIQCKKCATVFSVGIARANTAKFCSRLCSDSHPRPHQTTLCKECGVIFQKKSSQAKKALIGNFCSNACSSIAKSKHYMGQGNPNFKGRNFDPDGYRIYTPQASLGLGLGRMKMHHAIAFSTIGIKKLPLGMHVHHKDCDVLNNDPRNLQLMTASDHKWIHQQFGIAILHAIEHGKMSIDDVYHLSDDPMKAQHLLLTNVIDQSVMYKYMGNENNISQIVSSKPVRCEIIDVTDYSVFETVRGTGGLGSTGA